MKSRLITLFTLATTLVLGGCACRLQVDTALTDYFNARPHAAALQSRHISSISAWCVTDLKTRLVYRGDTGEFPVNLDLPCGTPGATLEVQLGQTGYSVLTTDYFETAALEGYIAAVLQEDERHIRKPA